MALTLVTSDLIHSLDYSKLTGTIPTWNQNTTGSAATLTTARNIGGVSFNGSAAIDLPGVNTAGNQPTSGNAGTVTNGVYTVGDQTIGGVKTFSNGVTISGANNTASKLILTNTASSNTWSFNPEYNSQDFTISEDANPRITLKSGGNVGIGITPTYKLDVGGSSAVLRVKETNGTDVRIVSGGSIGYIGTYTDHELRLLTNGTEKLTISSAGNVGIGTSLPTQSKLVISPNVGASALDGLTLSYHPDATAAQVRAKLFIDSYHGKFELTSGSGVVTTHISGGGTNTYFNASNVGVGTTSPTQSRLVVIDSTDASKQIVFSNNAIYYGSISHNAGTGKNEYRTEAGGGHSFFKGTETTPSLTISPVGETTITATNNSDTLTVKNTGTYGGTIAFTQGASTNIGYIGSLRAFEGNATSDNGVGLFSRTRMSFYINSSTPRLTISSGGKVGIGITSPSAKLDVHGTTGTRNFNTTSGQTSSIYETSRIYSAAGSTTTNVAIVTTTAFPTMGGGGYLMVEVSASGYGNGGTNGLVFSWIGGGYGGHYGTPGSLSYHPVEIIADTHHSSCNVSVYYPNYNTVGITIVNSSGTGMTGVMRVKVTTSY